PLAQFSPRSGRRVLVHHKHVRGNVRASPAGPGAISRCELFPLHAAHRGGLGATRGTRIVFPRPDDGAAHRLSIATLWNGAADPRSCCNYVYARAWSADDG